MQTISRRAAIPLLLARPLRAAAPKFSREPIAVISQQPAHYHAWATLARRKSGELIAAYSGSREGHVCPFGRLEIMHSLDDGRTWSWPRALFDSPIDDRDAGIVETPNGTLLVTNFTSIMFETRLAEARGWDPDRIERWRASLRGATPEQRRSFLGAWMLRSTDGGLSWSAPYRVPVTSPHGPVALRDGRMLFAGREFPAEDPAIGVCESRDDGVTWRWLGKIPPRPGDQLRHYHELHAVETGDGRIVAQIRNHNPANERETLQTESADGGETWSAPHPIGVWGLPSHLLRLRDGRLLMSYGYRRPPRGNHARISEDHGRTWSEPIVLSDDGKGDIGYPSTVELPNGELLTLWYESRFSGSTPVKLPDPPFAVLRLARWRLA